MRLQVAWLSLAVVLVSAPIAGQVNGRVDGWISVYSDDDDLQVVSPQVGAQAELYDRYQVEVAYDADIISAASVDVVTAASPRGYDEVRHGVRLGIGWRPEAATTLFARYLPSWEPDYRSHGVAAGASTEFWERNIDARLDVRANFDRVGRAGEPKQRWRDLTQLVVAPSIGWTVDPETTLQLAYELQLMNGFQASPYRFVTIQWTDAARSRIRIPETTPDQRTRHAIAVSTRRAVSKRWFVGLAYRFYVDSWAVVSHTAEAELQHAFLSDRVILGASVRGYWQGDADFYRERYVTPFGLLPKHRVADKMLSRQWSWLPGLRAELELGAPLGMAALRATTKLEVYDQHFLNFAPLEERRAVITSLGATGEF